MTRITLWEDVNTFRNSTDESLQIHLPLGALLIVPPFSNVLLS